MAAYISNTIPGAYTIPLHWRGKFQNLCKLLISPLWHIFFFWGGGGGGGQLNQKPGHPNVA